MKSIDKKTLNDMSKQVQDHAGINFSIKQKSEIYNEMLYLPPSSDLLFRALSNLVFLFMFKYQVFILYFSRWKDVNL